MARKLHPESEAFIHWAIKQDIQPYNKLTVEDARIRSLKVSKEFEGDPDFNGTTEELRVPVDGVPDGIPVSVYKADHPVTDPPVMVYFHGGGNVVGARENVASACQIISKGAKCIVVNVEHRLAPEHKFPTMMDDACAVTRWCLLNRTRLGASNRSRVGVSGDSGGAQIAATVAHEVAGLSFEILVYPPIVEKTQRTLPSYTEFKDGPVLTSDAINWFDRHAYNNEDYKSERAANILRLRFDNLPPTLLVVAECDPLRDDSYEYEKKLKQAGVHCELHLAKGAIHAFYTMPGIFKELCREAHGKAIDFIQTWGYCKN